MNVVDILVTIIVVTILVTIVLAVVTYIAYKLRLARRPTPSGNGEGPRYFDPHLPPVEAEPWVARDEGASEARPAARTTPEISGSRKVEGEPTAAPLEGGAAGPNHPDPATVPLGSADPERVGRS